VKQHLPDASVPLDLEAEWYVLIEVTSSRKDARIDDLLQNSLAAALEAGWVTDAVLAQNERERKNLWYLRENIPEAQRRAGASLKHDVSVSIDRLAEFLDQASSWVEREVPEALLICYGHAGDGNLHFNINEKVGAEPGALLARGEIIKRAIHDLTQAFGGSFSAEHGIGKLKVAELERYASPVELALMRQIKQSFDPNHILNPGKVLRG
jgi:FAD/FMN-containing dehydrogenase